MTIFLTISGDIPHGATTRVVTYFVVDRTTNAVVGNINLPDASTTARSFKLDVRVPSVGHAYDVGLFDDGGDFTSAGFKIDAPPAPTGAHA